MVEGSDPARRRLVGPVSGILYVVLVFVGGAAIARTSGPGRHSLDATPDEVVEYLAGVDVGRALVGEYVGLIGFLLFLPFAASAWSALVASDGRRDWLGGSAIAAAAIYVGLHAAGIATLAPALNRDDPARAAAFLDQRTTLLSLAFVVLGAWLVAVGTEALRLRTLPAWLAWSALAIGVLQIVLTPLAAYDPGFTGVPTFASFLWVLVASFVLLRRRADVAA